MNRNSKELISQLRSLADSEIAEHSTRFFKTGPGEYGEGDRFLGIRVPDLRKIARKYRSLAPEGITHLLNDPYHEIRLTGGLILTYKMQKASSEDMESIARFYLEHLYAFNNWDLVDSTCHKILGPYLENRDRKILYELAASDDLWKNRVSVITCLYFISRNDHIDALNISGQLLDHKHDLIHKAVGWVLREIGKRDLSIERDFLDRHYQTMPRTMLRYAIEHFDEELRQKYLKGGI